MKAQNADLRAAAEQRDEVQREQIAAMAARLERLEAAADGATLAGH